jgi:hypothetical protein
VKGRPDKIYDPKGNLLVPTLLHVMERDEHGNPTACRVRYDHEQIALAESGTDQNTFLLVWAPATIIMGELRMEDLTKELDETKEQRDMALRDLASARRDVDRLTADTTRAGGEVEDKTAALRELQKERDPARLERAVAERTEKLRTALDETTTAARAEATTLRYRITELEVSKKKLREALERERAKGLR